MRRDWISTLTPDTILVTRLKVQNHFILTKFKSDELVSSCMMYIHSNNGHHLNCQDSLLTAQITGETTTHGLVWWRVESRAVVTFVLFTNSLYVFMSETRFIL